MSSYRHDRGRPLAPCLLAAAIAVLLPLHASAQDTSTQQTPPPTTSTQPSQQPAVLDTIEVTATRRVQNIQDVPMAITAVSGEKLDVLTSGGDDVRLLAGRLPSLNIESSYGRSFPRFYVRGLGNTDFDLNASQPVSLVYDDVVQENPILKGFPMFDMDQVEMYRGPAEIPVQYNDSNSQCGVILIWTRTEP